MTWAVEFTDEFGEWWGTLTEAEREDIVAVVELLEELGPTLRYPRSSGVNNSRHTHMRELRIQHAGRPYRVLYAFNPLSRGREPGHWKLWPGRRGFFPAPLL